MMCLSRKTQSNDQADPLYHSNVAEVVQAWMVILNLIFFCFFHATNGFKIRNDKFSLWRL